ncbi:esterase-like activity of phytase family protein [Porphyrobacter sp. AAP60]|uniref:esterase-like activity of phytase family protein n=1 Tax=Porphyrobacter sp. AAP60 TaxID=1523423 RepID=UPI0006B9BA92|nr:esterase-like activity of phytase family protein [Porphyrobacter sp. AAP60]
MPRARRLIAALAVTLLCAPGTWLRSHVDIAPPQEVAVSQVARAAATDATGWALAGVWQYRAEGLRFGGFSAMLALGPGRLRAFTDRGFRMTFSEPDLPDPDGAMNRQHVVPGWENDLTDIESATRDPDGGYYWIGYEQVHAILRHTIASTPDGVRDLRELVDWPENGGIEAMVRTADGRFIIVPETGNEGLIFARDPVAGGKPQTFRFRSPAKGYVATDMAQLPDGRLLVLMRDLVRPSRAAWPPFSALLAIGDPPAAGGVFAPAVTLRLDDVIPRENYEGLTLRPRDDGRVDVWVISDDNFSIMQRTLLAKLVFDPGA